MLSQEKINALDAIADGIVPTWQRTMPLPTALDALHEPPKTTTADMFAAKSFPPPTPSNPPTVLPAYTPSSNLTLNGYELPKRGIDWKKLEWKKWLIPGSIVIGLLFLSLVAYGFYALVSSFTSKPEPTQPSPVPPSAPVAVPQIPAVPQVPQLNVANENSEAIAPSPARPKTSKKRTRRRRLSRTIRKR